MDEFFFTFSRIFNWKTMIFMFDIQLKKRLSRNYNYQESILIKKNFKHILF